MGLTKRTYTDNVTVITAENLNDIQDAIIALEETPAQGLTEDMKQALLQLARKVAYIDDQGQTYYDDLYDALYPPKTVVSITAVFEQGTTVIYDDTALNDLKQYLTVTAIYDDNTTAILPDASYTLSGTLEAGTSSVTVNYNGVVTSFDVVVTARPALSSISAVYTQSGTVYDTDTLDSLKADLVVTAHYSDSSTQTVPAADYTLSGTLTEGTSTITVSYGGKTTTFNVTVTSGTLSGYTSVGSPTITDGILSVADGKFVKSNVAFSPGNSPWRITCKYRNTTGTYASYTDIFGSVDSSNASYRSLLLESTINTGTALSMYLSSNGTSWDIGSGNNTQATNVPAGRDVWVWIDFSYTGSAYELRFSSDGETFTLGKSYPSSTAVIDGYAVGFGMKRNGYLQGEIDLNECKIYIDGALWWKAIA